MVDSFFKYIQYEKRYSPHTILSYQTDIDQFSKFIASEFEITDLKDASYSVIRAWILSLVENQLSSKSVNRKIASLKAYYKFLLRKGIIEANPTSKVVAPKIKKRLPAFIEKEKMEQLLDHLHFGSDFCGLRDKLILELLYGTGIRLSELLALKDKDIDLRNSTVKVLGKGNKERIIPMNKTLINNISIYIEVKKRDMADVSGGYFIITDKGEKCYPVFIYRKVKEYLEAVTTSEKKSPHVLRHTFATHLLNKGADLNAIKDLLGHSSLAATQVYTHNSLEKLKAIFDQAHPKS